MLKTIRSLPSLGLAVLICLASAQPGCRRQADQGPKRYQIATVVKVDGIAWFEQMRAGVRKFAAETGHDAFLLGPAKADAAEQIQIIEGLIAQQVDAICVVPFSVEALEPVLKKARGRGIVVIAHEASSQINADLIIEPFDNASNKRPSRLPPLSPAGTKRLDRKRTRQRTMGRWPMPMAVSAPPRRWVTSTVITMRTEPIFSSGIDFGCRRRATVTMGRTDGIPNGPASRRLVSAIC